MTKKKNTKVTAKDSYNYYLIHALAEEETRITVKKA